MSLTYGIHLHLKPPERHAPVCCNEYLSTGLPDRAVAETEGIYRASDVREVGRGGLGAVCAGEVAESAPQGALGWGAGLDVGAVTRRYAP